MASILKLRPSVLVVRLDRGLGFSQAQLEPDIRIEMAVGQMVHDLKDGPAPGAIRFVQWLGGKTRDGRTQSGRRSGNAVDKRAALVMGYAGCDLELSNRVLQVVHSLDAILTLIRIWSKLIVCIVSMNYAHRS